MNILILEDQLLIAQDISDTLNESNFYHTHIVNDLSAAKMMLSNKEIHLVLIDVKLKNNESGIQIGEYLNKKKLAPHIYITSHSDKEIVDSLKKTCPSGFLLKPFTKMMLQIVVEIALHNHYYDKTNTLSNQIDDVSTSNETFNCIVNDSLIIKENYSFKKIPLSEILWFRSDKNYIEVKTINQKHLIRCTLKKMIENLPSNKYLKCYKTYIINLSYVDTFTRDSVHIMGYKIPVSRFNQKEVMEAMRRL